MKGREESLSHKVAAVGALGGHLERRALMSERPASPARLRAGGMGLQSHRFWGPRPSGAGLKLEVSHVT